MEARLRVPVRGKRALSTTEYTQFAKARSLPASPEPFLTLERQHKVHKGLTFALLNREKPQIVTSTPRIEVKILHRRKGKTASLDWSAGVSENASVRAFLTAGQKATLHMKALRPRFAAKC